METQTVKTEKKAKRVSANGVAKVKKPRKQRAVMRSRKVSVAGHYADRLAANLKQFGDIMKAVANFPGSPSTVDALNTLASSGFVPARKRGGRTAVTFTPGQSVTLADEARNMLRPQFPDIDTASLFVSASYNPTDKTKSVPVKADVADLTGRWVGFVSKGFVNAAA